MPNSAIHRYGIQCHSWSGSKVVQEKPRHIDSPVVTAAKNHCALSSDPTTSGQRAISSGVSLEYMESCIS